MDRKTFACSELYRFRPRADIRGAKISAAHIAALLHFSLVADFCLLKSQNDAVLRLGEGMRRHDFIALLGSAYR